MFTLFVIGGLIYWFWSRETPTQESVASETKAVAVASPARGAAINVARTVAQLLLRSRQQRAM